MKVPEPEEEQPIAWTAILLHTPVFSVDDLEVGVVREVLGSQTEDIFHGVVATLTDAARDAQILAANIVGITNRRVNSSLTAQEIRDLPVYQEEESYKLGFVGLLKRRVGWTRDLGSGPK